MSEPAPPTPTNEPPAPSKQLRPNVASRVINLDPAQVPAPIAQRRIWVCWVYEWREDKEGEGKWTKRPVRPNGKAASTTKPGTWSSLAEVMHPSTAVDGIGCVFDNELNEHGCVLAGIDYDSLNKRQKGEDDDSSMFARKHRFTRVYREAVTINAYMEQSPSGSGVHILGFATPLLKGFKRDSVETYTSGRFFTYTGKKARGALVDITALRDAIIAEIEGIAPGLPTSTAPVPPKLKLPDAPAPDRTGSITCDDLSENIRFEVKFWLTSPYSGSPQNRVAWQRLWDGDASDYRKDPSSATMALVMLLMHRKLTDDEIDQAVRASGFYRPKWDERRGSSTWGWDTILRARRKIEEDRNAAGGPPPVPASPPGAPPGTPPGPAPIPTPHPRPVIICAAGELNRMYREAEDALIQSGAEIYQRNVLVQPVTVEFDAAPQHGSTTPRKTHSTALLILTAPVLTLMLAQTVDFRKFDGREKKYVSCDPPGQLVSIILTARSSWQLPSVRGVLTTPTLRPDGTLLTAPGYDPMSRFYLAIPSNLMLPAIPDTPTRADAEASLARLDALLDGYAFVNDGEVSRSVALALLMAPVLRCAMLVAPMLNISATAPGTGKSHLVDLAGHIVIGRWCPIITAGKDDKETEKGLNAMALSGVSFFSVDNVHRALDLEVLNTATERPMITIRKFGVLESVEVENGTTICMTGNNLGPVDEQIRRTLVCAMDAGEERPERRKFKVDPLAQVLADRGRYIADILIIARAYITYLANGGAKPDIPPLGSYAGWDRFVREPLVWLGRADPVASQDAAREEDPETAKRNDIITAWHNAFGETPQTLAEAARYVLRESPYDEVLSTDERDAEAKKAEREARHQLFDVLENNFPVRSGGGGGVNTVHFGHWLRRFAGRLTGGWKFVKVPKEKSKAHTTAEWKLTH